jgi:hypothetical protein
MRELICRRFVSEQEKSPATRGASHSPLIFEFGNYPHQVAAVIYIIMGILDIAELARSGLYVIDFL